MFLLRSMLREEYRMHSSYSSPRMFRALPLFVLAVALVTSLALDEIRGGMGLEELMLNVNAMVFMYGISVGALGFLGKTIVERRQGRQNFLIAMPSLLPLSYRSTFLRFFLADAIFYLALLLLPALAGVLLSVPLTRFSILSILSAFVALTLSFLLGMALSFFASVAGTRSRGAFLLIAAAFLVLLLGYGALDLYGIETVLPSMGYQLNAPPLGSDLFLATAYLVLSVGLVAALSTAAVHLVPQSFEGRGGSHRELFPSYVRRFSPFGSFTPFLAKEMVDLRRSGAVWKMIISFIIPLAVLSFTSWYINHGLDIPVGFNIVFYAAMVGFFSVMMYTSLTDVDVRDYYETLPVDVPCLIRTKLMVFLLLTLGISTAFVLGIAVLNGETGMLWLALPVLYVMSVYMVIATAYLTGLHPNSSLFDPGVLGRFLLISILPNLGLTILSFSVGRAFIAAPAIVGVLTVLLLAAALFYRRLDVKWAGRGFN